MKSCQGQLPWVTMLVCVSLAFATPAEAQRSGFVIGFGLGPGHYSVSSAGSSSGKTGLGFDFHIGGVVGSGVEIYHFQKGVVSGSDATNIDVQGSGVSGVGVAFPASPKFDVHGGVGLGVWAEGRSGSTETELNGLGLVAGGRLKLNESGRWMLNFDLMYAAEPVAGVDASVLAFSVTVNVMSH